MSVRKEGKIKGYDINDPKQKEELVRYLAEEYAAGKSIKEALGVSDRLLENLYAVAYRKYQSGDYSKAADLFRYLLMFDDRCYKYLLGLAASLHKLEEWRLATHLYLVAAIYNPEDPVAYFHAADCLMHLGETEAALANLEIASAYAKQQEQYRELGERANLIINALSS
ncbi:MAG: SycD/LcrH family type III secretion system chaperone [Parachlamydiales bacterium]